MPPKRRAPGSPRSCWVASTARRRRRPCASGSPVPCCPPSRLASANPGISMRPWRRSPWVRCRRQRARPWSGCAPRTQPSAASLGQAKVGCAETGAAAIASGQPKTLVARRGSAALALAVRDHGQDLDLAVGDQVADHRTEVLEVLAILMGLDGIVIPVDFEHDEAGRVLGVL